MKFEILTIFPDFFRGPLDYGIVRKAREAGLIEIGIHDLRTFTHDRHRTVDDRPFGGGEGMVLKPEPIFECLESMAALPRAERMRDGCAGDGDAAFAAGRVVHAGGGAGIDGRERVVLICGRYEGVDERVSEHLADREISVGDFVLSGGELGAAIIVDAMTRLGSGSAGQCGFVAAGIVYGDGCAGRRGIRASRRARHAVLADCSIIRTTRVRRSFAGCRFPKCW